jgi:4-hydroxybenzoate polyprenyltransferase
MLAASAGIAGQGRLTLQGVALGLAWTSLAMFGFAVNDICDYYKDRAAGVQRPVAAGTLTRRSAAWLAIAVLLAACLFSAAAGLGGRVLATAGVGLLLYSPVAQRYPLCKDVYVAGLCCCPLYAGALVGGRQYPWFSYAVLVCFVLGREMLMDSHELPGDSKAGLRTIAAVLGPCKTMGIGTTLMIVAAVSLAALAHGRLATMTSAVTLVFLTCVFASPGLEQGRRISLSRLPMLLGCVAVACGGA